MQVQREDFERRCDRVLADIWRLPNKVEKSSRAEAIEIAAELRKQVKAIRDHGYSTGVDSQLEKVREVLRTYDTHRETSGALGGMIDEAAGNTLAEVGRTPADPNLEILNALRDRSVQQYATSRRQEAWKLCRTAGLKPASADMADTLGVSRVEARNLVVAANRISIAGALTLVTSAEEAEAVLSNSFAAQNPYRPDIFESFRAIMTSAGGPTTAIARSVNLLWDAADNCLTERLLRPREYSVEDYSPVVTALLIMALSSWAEIDVAARVRATRNRLRQGGVADRPFIKRHLAALEAFSGNVGVQRDFLVDPKHQNVEFAGVYHFVNGGIQPRVAKSLVEAGLTVSDLPTAHGRPRDTLSPLAKHIVKCVKVFEAYRGPWLGPMLLTWTRGWVLAGVGKPASIEMKAIRTVLLHQHRRELNADPFCRSLYADVEAGLTNG